MAWAAVVLVVLLIPILAIVLDSEIGRAFARRISKGSPDSGQLASRIDELETEVRYLSEALGGLQDETQFVRSLIEKPKEEPEAELGPGD